jgi:Zn-dependent protease with chaperone function
MATAILTGNLEDAEKLAHQWSSKQGFKVLRCTMPEPSCGKENCTERETITAQKHLWIAKWTIEPASGSTIVQMTVRPAWYVALGLLAFEYLGVALAFNSAFDNISQRVFLVIAKLFIGCAVVATTFAWIHRLNSVLGSLENLFWSNAQRVSDITLLTRVGGSPEWRWELFIPLGSFFVAVICGAVFFGTKGIIVAFFLLAPLLLVDVLQTLLTEKPQWNWRLWVVENVTRWIMVMQAVIAIAFVLVMVEGLMVGLGESGYGTVRNLLLWIGQHRKVMPATAVVLESDAKERMEEWARVSVGSPENVREDFLVFLRRILPKVTAATFLAVVLGVTIVFHKITFGDILKRALLWRKEVLSGDYRCVPFVPSLPGAWKWESHGVMVVTVLHWLFGAVINIAACVFAVEGLSYMLTGHVIFIAETAYLWSWVFAWSNMLFGVKVGRVIASVEVLLVALPFLMCCLRLVHQIARLFLKWLMVLTRQSEPTSSDSKHFMNVKDFVHKLCTSSGIHKPILLLTNSPEVRVRVSQFPLIGIGLLELSKGAVNVLEPDELKAVIAHELGHLRHGLLLVSLLKVLSIIALFPNYYLTLCVNWAKREMEADKFALQHIDRPDTLRHALVKISAAELWNTSRTTVSKTSEKIARCVGLSNVPEPVSELIMVGRFFFGDGILGYTHPLLSERLAAITAFQEEHAEYEPKNKSIEFDGNKVL